MLKRDALFSAIPQTVEVELASAPLAGERISIRSLPVAAFLSWRKLADDGDPVAPGMLIVESLVEPKLERKDAARIVNELSPELVTEILGAINRHNGWAPKDEVADDDAGFPDA